MTSQLRTKGLPDLRRRLGQMLAEPFLEGLRLPPQFLLRRFPFQFELACSACAAVMRETEEVERARSPFTQPRGIATSC